MPGIDLKKVRSQITIQQVLDMLGFAPTARRGPRLRGPCPIHGDCRPQSQVFERAESNQAASLPYKISVH